MFRPWALAFVLPAILIPGRAQEPAPKVSIVPRRVSTERTSAHVANLRMDVRVVNVPVTVTDTLNRPVTTLPQSSFRVLDDGVEQKIASFSRDEGPVSLGLLFDSSGSMQGRIDASITALNSLFQTTLPGDEFFLVQFADRARLLAPFTSSTETIAYKLGFVQPKGWTALLDAIALGAQHMRSARNPRRVLLILSDGADNNSRFTASEIKNMVVESDLRIYAIGLFHKPRLLLQLAEETGGRVLIAQSLKELPEIVEALSAEIRSQYVLGYAQTNLQNDGKYHKVKVEVVPPPGLPPIWTNWRRGYYAPND